MRSLSAIIIVLLFAAPALAESPGSPADHLAAAIRAETPKEMVEHLSHLHTNPRVPKLFERALRRHPNMVANPGTLLVLTLHGNIIAAALDAEKPLREYENLGLKDRGNRLQIDFQSSFDYAKEEGDTPTSLYKVFARAGNGLPEAENVITTNEIRYLRRFPVIASELQIVANFQTEAIQELVLTGLRRTEEQLEQLAASDYPGYINDLIANFEGSNNAVRWDILSAIQDRLAVEATPWLMELAKNDIKYELKAYEILGDFPPDAETAAFLAERYRQDTSKFRGKILRALLKHNPANTEELLLEALESDNSIMRREALRGLAEESYPKAFKQLTKLEEDYNETELTLYYKAIALANPRRSLRILDAHATRYLEAINGDDQKMKTFGMNMLQTVIEGIILTGEPKALDIMEKAYTDGPDRVKITVAHSLGKMPDEKAAEFALRLAGETENAAIKRTLESSAKRIQAALATEAEGSS